MFTGLGGWQMLKSKTNGEGGISYIIILKKRWFFPRLYKTATLYSPVKASINNNDFRNYPREINEGNLEICNEEEIADINEYIENLPGKIRKQIYKQERVRLFPNSNSQYKTEMQKVSKMNSLESLSEKLSERIYKKALSITQILPL
jgi:hypothetical protein